MGVPLKKVFLTAERPGVEWLDRQIHFAIWTAADIAKMPATHVSEWARANDVDIVKNYMQENREGGLMALGTGFPGIKRQDLLVLPEGEWERMKDSLTYEAWAAKMKQAEAASGKR